MTLELMVLWNCLAIEAVLNMLGVGVCQGRDGGCQGVFNRPRRRLLLVAVCRRL